MNAPTRNGRIGIALALGGLMALAAPYVRAKDGPLEVEYVLPDIALADAIEDAQPELGPVDDHGIDLGGIGSDLWYAGNDDRDRDGCGGSRVYWMLTDRGPNGDDPRTFPVPEFTPLILKVRTRDARIEILDVIPIRTGPGSSPGVTGLPNFDNVTAPPAPNEPFFACDGLTELDTNPDGIDPEGLVRTRDGYFWVCEEYSPSLLKVDPTGRVVRRFLPNGMLAAFATPPTYPTDDSSSSVPAIFGAKRKLNRGFEGIALAPNGKTLYLALQSPLRNPDNATGDAARVTRILAFDLRTETVVAEYVYRFQLTGPGNADDEFDVPALGTTGRARPRDMKLSALAMLDEHRMLVLERTDFKAKVFRVDLRDATNILGSKWDDVATAPSLEALVADGALEAEGIAPLGKVEILTLDSTQGYPQKIEGLAILDEHTLAIANDNDFGLGSFADKLGDCTLVDSGIESRIVVIPLDEPLKGKPSKQGD